MSPCFESVCVPPPRVLEAESGMKVWVSLDVWLGDYTVSGALSQIDAVSRLRTCPCALRVASCQGFVGAACSRVLCCHRQCHPRGLARYVSSCLVELPFSRVMLLRPFGLKLVRTIGGVRRLSCTAFLFRGRGGRGWGPCCLPVAISSVGEIEVGVRILLIVNHDVVLQYSRIASLFSTPV